MRKKKIFNGRRGGAKFLMRAVILSFGAVLVVAIQSCGYVPYYLITGIDKLDTKLDAGIKADNEAKMAQARASPIALIWPARGEVSAYGDGILIVCPPGAPVFAAAAGKVSIRASTSPLGSDTLIITLRFILGLFRANSCCWSRTAKA